jgi:hypothetical protein
MAKYMFFQDPGHGWVKVSLKELQKLGIADKISVYSYRRKDSVYLEEDCDLHTFDQAKRARGEGVVLVERHTNRASKIRNYDRYIG